MSQLKKQNGCFLIRFRWCSVDGRKRYKNASVDEKLFIRFQETENALVWTGPKETYDMFVRRVCGSCQEQNKQAEVCTRTVLAKQRQIVPKRRNSVF